MLVGLLWLGLAGAAELADGVACVVNDDVITLSEIYDDFGDAILNAAREQCRQSSRERTACVRAIEMEAAQILIMGALVRQKLQENGFDVTDAQLESFIDMYQAENGVASREQLKVALAAEGSNYEAFREAMRDSARMRTFQQAFLLSKVRVTEDEIRDRYRRATRDAQTEDTLDLSYKAYTLPADASDEAIAALMDGLRERLAQGPGAFDALGEVAGVTPVPLASRYTPSQLLEAFRPVAKLEIGGVGGPYRVATSMFVFRLDGRRPGSVVPYEQVREAIEQQLLEAKLTEEADRWFQTATRSASISCTMER
jgi:parvulin-like peptidyl-prolyl isomerase